MKKRDNGQAFVLGGEEAVFSLNDGRTASPPFHGLLSSCSSWSSMTNTVNLNKLVTQYVLSDLHISPFCSIDSYIQECFAFLS